MLLALQLIIGREEVWLPRRWRNLRFEGHKRERFIARLIKAIRRLERWSRPRGRFLSGRRMTNTAFGALVLAGTVAAFVAPPFSMLDTLPALGVVVLSLGVLLDDAIVAAVGVAIGAGGIALVVLVGRAALRGIEDLIGLTAAPLLGCVLPITALVTRNAASRRRDAAPAQSLPAWIEAAASGSGRCTLPYVATAPGRGNADADAPVRAYVGSVTTTQPQPAERTPVPPGAAPLIRLENVGRRYRVGDNAVVALADVSFEVRAEELVVVLGPSGCGKTTLLNLIGALDSPSEGRVVVAGRDITRASRKELSAFRRHGVSFVFQTFNLFPALTALENVEFGADVAGRPNPTDVAAQMLERVGLGDRLRHFPHELSGGGQQRVAIARALASGNPTLPADERTGELDFRTGIQILELLHAQAHTGCAVVVVTHNREIARVADRVIELSSGRLVREGPPEGGQVEIADLRW
jgi:putative ABC transport system ATP-binding protein